jgi:hypothetical protein
MLPAYLQLSSGAFSANPTLYPGLSRAPIPKPYELLCDKLAIPLDNHVAFLRAGETCGTGSLCLDSSDAIKKYNTGEDQAGNTAVSETITINVEENDVYISGVLNLRACYWENGKSAFIMMYVKIMCQGRLGKAALIIAEYR